MPPVVTAIAGIASSIGFGAAASAWIGAFVVRVTLSLAFSALARALAPKPKLPGLTNEATQTGGTDPQSFLLGRYATGGQLVAPPMTHGNVGKTPNAYLTYVIAVSDVPGVTLSRLFIDGEVAVIGGVADPDYGTPVELKGTAGRAWVKWYDGTQTVADPMLIAKYGAHPERPWSADMVGTGVAYAILTFRFDRNLFKGFPAVRIEVDGIALYDPRKDPSLGGSGTHDWSDPSTWEQTDNPAVMIYNILRGIPIPGGDVWGGGWDEGDLRTDEWFAAMNVCDEPVALAAGGTEPRFRAGMEITVDQEPADAIEELLKTCTGRMADVGGVMKIVVGPPGAPVKVITDDDIIITDEQSASLFPSLAQTHNGVHATFPDPASLWENRDAPPRYDATAETADGRRLIATVSLPACPYGDQVQRLMQAWINEERRFRRHQHVLPPDFTILEPLDVFAWTSNRNGYSGKTFEVDEIVHDPVSLLQAGSYREVDAADYDWDTSLEVPWVAPTPGTSLTPPQGVPSFAASGIALDDTNGDPRRPAIILTWDGTDLDDVSALEYELRLQGGVQVVSGATLSVASGSLVISAGIIPDTAYEARARLIAPRPVSWTAWTLATTPGTYIAPTDFGTQIDSWFADAGISVPRLVNTLPPNDGSRVDDEWVYLVPEKKLYRWSAAATDWVSIIDPEDIPDGALDGSKVAYATLVAGLFAAGAVRAGDMTIDGNLRLDAAGAGFSIGKDDAADNVNTGLYVGRRVAPGGGVGFGFLLGTTSLSGVPRSISASDDQGVAAVNMTFGLLADLAPAAASYTTSQTVALAGTTKSITLTLLGGGGGSTTVGGQTKVELYEAGAPTGIEWTADGGAANGAATKDGQNSILGSGGIGSLTVWRGGENGDWSTTPGTDATGYGAGGGGRWHQSFGTTLGGGAAQPTYVVAYDVSGYTSPSLVITIGAKGTGITEPSPGIVKVQQFTKQVVPAGVIPFAPTATGTFVKGAGATGAAIFPDFSSQKGLWVISNSAGSGGLGMAVKIDSAGTVHDVTGIGSLSFISDIRPEVTTSDGTARTIQYAFYRMSVED
ncbi:putative tail protein [Defluviimonas denitrificans]|jgi:hypothetical protein|uniref:Putative tail protein n=1 Tax=Albidovulum denitrificans TaxID=404881 RepID=A0A2S8S6J8_9RHOB|nr:phage tail protein [Defluviimonas denitrificans]PQV56415.1 putative tail protein [Defluviimonas denitrificans]